MADITTCRLCSEEKTSRLSPLFDNETAKMLQDLTAMKIARNDNIPSSVCSECLYDLKNAYKIQQRMIAAETKYHNELVADFLIENHDELMKIIQQMQNKIHVGEDSSVENSSVTDSNAEESPVKHKCQICSYKFQFSPDYVKHLQKHISKNKSPSKSEILCELCGIILTDSHQYETHMDDIHTGTHKCFYCSEKFDTSITLDAHVKELHSDKKPYVCNVCNERFAIRYILTLHKAQHNIVKPFACEICGQKFKQNISLKVHQRLMHREVGP